jgi:hypothetical protein
MNMMFAIPSRELVSSLVPALNARFWQYIDISLINKQAIELFDYPWAPSSQHSMQGLPLLADGLRFLPWAAVELSRSHERNIRFQASLHLQKYIEGLRRRSI